MSCPYCGWSVSAIVRSRGGIVQDKVHRRRECAQCGRLFPTAERVDRELLERELGATGELGSSPLFDPPAPPATWAEAERLLHLLWGQAKDREYVKTDWLALQQVLTGLKRSA